MLKENSQKPLFINGQNKNKPYVFGHNKNYGLKNHLETNGGQGEKDWPSGVFCKTLGWHIQGCTFVILNRPKKERT